MDEVLLQKRGVEQDFEVECYKCEKIFTVKEFSALFPSKEKYFCSKSCANSHFVTLEHREKTSKSIRNFNLSIGNTVKPLMAISKICGNCEIEFDTFNIEQIFCCRKCALCHRNKSKRANRSALANYRSDCTFKFNLADYPEEFDFTLVEQYGWYKASNRGNNLNGVSRDHMVSVKYGFTNGIDPKIIAHPANCKLIRHSKNSSKCDNCSITLDELVEKIKVWNDKYNII